MIDILLIGIAGLVFWCVSSEEFWGAALNCLCVIFAGLLAMNYFEPLAAFLERTIRTSGSLRDIWDVVSLSLLFGGGVFGLRAATDNISPGQINVHPLLNNGGRWICAAISGYATMAILLTALHTAPLPRNFAGFTPERTNLLGMAAPDRQWLGFTQHVSEKVFRKGSGGQLFDGPQFTLPEGAAANERYPNSVWPSFPIRYATRRERGTPAAAGAGPAAPVIIKPPSSGGQAPGAQPAF